MKLRTSYFNDSVFQKNLTRFAPAWALYTIAGLLITVTIYADSPLAYYASAIGESLKFMGVINLGYAFLVAALIFGDLFNSRMCNALHAMPMRREGWFLTNVTSGLAFSVLPNAVIALFMALLLEEYWYMGFLWLLGATLQYVFFFGVAVFSAYCVGGRFAMVLVYGLVNFLSVLAFFLVYTIYSSTLYGIEIMEDQFFFFSPVLWMAHAPYGDMLSDGVRDTIFTVVWDGYLYSAVCAVIGLVFMGVGLLIYRRRALEGAGDFITVRGLKPVFLVLYTLCAGAVLYTFEEVFGGGAALLFMFIGIICGFFTGKMLLERTLKVFNKRSAIGLGVFVLCFAVSILLARIDPLGLTRWVPKAGNVKQVVLMDYYNRYDSEEGVIITDADEIEDMLKIHTYGVKNRTAGDDGLEDARITLRYTLKSGIQASRNYYINIGSEEGAMLKEYLSRPEYVLGVTAEELDVFIEDLYYFEFGAYGEPEDPAQIRELMVAMLLDCEAGTMAQRSSFHPGEYSVCWINYNCKNAKYGYREVQIYTDCENTMAWLMKHRYLLEDEKFPEDVIFYEEMPVTVIP